MAAFDRVSSSASSRLLSSSQSVMEGEGAIAEDALFVAVSSELDESKSVLLWALQNRGMSEICVLHVHRPDKYIPTAMGMFPVSGAKKPQIDAHRVAEREILSKKLDNHLQFCQQNGVEAGKIYVEVDSIKDGIVKLISEKKIGKLVMGAAADGRYSKDMIEILSKKAKYVKQHAPSYCHIWFVCNTYLIHTRKATEKPGSLYPEIYEGDDRLRLATGSFVVDKLISTYGYSPSSSGDSGPSAPDLTLYHGQKEIDAWLLTQQMQKPYDMTPSSSMPREVENVKNQTYKTLEKSNLMVEEWERTTNKSAAKMVENYKKERDEMQMERDNAIKQVDELKKQLKERVSSVHFPILSSELNFQDIEKTTNKFDQSLKVGEDAYGITYKGFFNLEVVVKIPHPSSSSAPQEFQEEVEILYKLRHPNIVNLIGICPESQVLIYEYCANGNLEDQISYKVEGSPLLWKTRIKIATELCTVLMFLHSHKPQPIIHGDLRAENIHLDSHFTCKLNDFRTSISISKGRFSLENTARLYRTDSRAMSFANTDPEFFATGDLTTRSDVYSFGIILLRLLTGKPAVRLIREMQSAVDNTDELSALLDPSAEWPLEQAKLLADIALRCCEMTRDRRPDLEPDVWKVLESMKGLCD